jgi:hypothetical protein
VNASSSELTSPPKYQYRFVDSIQQMLRIRMQSIFLQRYSTPYIASIAKDIDSNRVLSRSSKKRQNDRGCLKVRTPNYNLEDLPLQLAATQLILRFMTCTMITYELTARSMYRSVMVGQQVCCQNMIADIWGSI